MTSRDHLSCERACALPSDRAWRVRRWSAQAMGDSHVVSLRDVATANSGVSLWYHLRLKIRSLRLVA